MASTGSIEHETVITWRSGSAERGKIERDSCSHTSELRPPEQCADREGSQSCPDAGAGAGVGVSGVAGLATREQKGFRTRSLLP